MARPEAIERQRRSTTKRNVRVKEKKRRKARAVNRGGRGKKTGKKRRATMRVGYHRPVLLWKILCLLTTIPPLPPHPPAFLRVRYTVAAMNCYCGAFLQITANNYEQL